MKFLKRILGVCKTPTPANKECWEYGDNKAKVNLSLAQELINPGEALRLEGKNLPERLLIVHGSDGKFYAYCNKCTHMGRRIDPVPGKKALECCSLFRSTFDYSGTPMGGAAKQPLKSFKVKLQGDILIIDLV